LYAVLSPHRASVSLNKQELKSKYLSLKEYSGYIINYILFIPSSLSEIFEE
jgi:hypothetical protein